MLQQARRLLIHTDTWQHSIEGLGPLKGGVKALLVGHKMIKYGNSARLLAKADPPPGLAARVQPVALPDGESLRQKTPLFVDPLGSRAAPP